MMDVLSQQRIFRQKEAMQSIWCVMWTAKDTDRRMMNRRKMDGREECINWRAKMRIEGHVVYVCEHFQEKMYFSLTIHYQEVIRKCFKLKFKVIC